MFFEELSGKSIPIFPFINSCLGFCIFTIVPSMTESTSSATTRTAQPWENSFSPYFLSSGDNPSVSLVVQPFTEENYNTWSRAILISLDAKTKLGFIDGFIP